MKVEILQNKTPYGLENEVNNWLEENCVIVLEIQYNTTPMSNGVLYNCMIVYNEIKEDPILPDPVEEV